MEVLISKNLFWYPILLISVHSFLFKIRVVLYGSIHRNFANMLRMRVWAYSLRFPDIFLYSSTCSKFPDSPEFSMYTLMAFLLSYFSFFPRWIIVLKFLSVSYKSHYFILIVSAIAKINFLFFLVSQPFVILFFFQLFIRIVFEHKLLFYFLLGVNLSTKADNIFLDHQMPSFHPT